MLLALCGALLLAFPALALRPPNSGSVVFLAGTVASDRANATCRAVDTGGRGELELATAEQLLAVPDVFEHRGWAMTSVGKVDVCRHWNRGDAQCGARGEARGVYCFSPFDA